MGTYFTLASYALAVYATASFAQKWAGSKTLEQEQKLGYSTFLYLVLEYASYLIISAATLLFSNHGDSTIHVTSINYYALWGFTAVYFFAATVITAVFGAMVDSFVLSHYQKKRLNTNIDVEKAKQDLQSKL